MLYTDQSHISKPQKEHIEVYKANLLIREICTNVVTVAKSLTQNINAQLVDECAVCKKKGHYKAVCRKRLTQVREADDCDTEEGDFLGQILQINNVDKCSWSADVKINRELHSFKLDTGA